MSKEMGLAEVSAPIDPAAEKAALEKVISGAREMMRKHPNYVNACNPLSHDGWGGLRLLCDCAEALLAQPRLPAEPTTEMLDAMITADTEFAVGTPKEFRRRAAYRALYAHLTKPKTKTVEVWHVEHFANGMALVTVRRSRAEADATARNAADVGDTCIHVTGPHKQEVLA